jgi:outer membrane immunogenic protein
VVRTVRGRVGPTITPTILDYVTGGLAYGEVKSTDTVSGINIANPGGRGTNAGTVLTLAAATFGNSNTRAGWIVGAGVEGFASTAGQAEPGPRRRLERQGVRGPQAIHSLSRLNASQTGSDTSRVSAPGLAVEAKSTSVYNIL